MLYTFIAITIPITMARTLSTTTSHSSKGPQRLYQLAPLGWSPVADEEDEEDEAAMAEIRRMILAPKPFRNAVKASRKEKIEHVDAPGSEAMLKHEPPGPPVVNSNKVSGSANDFHDFNKIATATPVTDRTGARTLYQITLQQMIKAMLHDDQALEGFHSLPWTIQADVWPHYERQEVRLERFAHARAEYDRVQRQLESQAKGSRRQQRQKQKHFVVVEDDDMRLCKQ
jgi:hypothetical protein